MKRLLLVVALALVVAGCPGETKWTGRLYDNLHGRTIELLPRASEIDCKAEYVGSDFFTSPRYTWLGCEER